MTMESFEWESHRGRDIRPHVRTHACTHTCSRRPRRGGPAKNSGNLYLTVSTLERGLFLLSFSLSFALSLSRFIRLTVRPFVRPHGPRTSTVYQRARPHRNLSRTHSEASLCYLPVTRSGSSSFPRRSRDARRVSTSFCRALFARH